MDTSLSTNLLCNPPPLVLTPSETLAMTLNSVDAPYSPAVFGPSAWFILHRAAARTSMDNEFPSITEARKTFGALLSSLYTMIPCDICSKHTASYMNKWIPVNPVFSSILQNNHTLSVFLYEFHTSVNENYAVNSDTYVKPSYKDAIENRFETKRSWGYSLTLDYDNNENITRAVFFFLFNGAAKVSPSVQVQSQMRTGQMVDTNQGYGEPMVTQKWLKNPLLEHLVDFFESCWVLFPVHTKSRKVVKDTISKMTRVQLMEKLSPRTGAFMFVYELYVNSGVSKDLKKETVQKIASRFNINVESRQTLEDNLSW